MWAEVSALNLVKAVPALQMPVFFFLGRHDHVVAAETSVAYFDMLTAPSKKLVWFEESAHEPPSRNRPSSTQRWWNWCGQSPCNKCISNLSLNR